MDIVAKIQKLKKARNAVILAHNYQLPEVQDIADYLGDSLDLSRKAQETQAEVIVFCGVYFMAETAKILSPQKTVLIPDKEAGCPMAGMITAESLKELKAKRPRARVLGYVNTPAAVKAECDLCCTSANAVRVVKEDLSDAAEIIFVPDKYLAGYVASRTGRDFICWEGYCPSHVRILTADILCAKKMHPEAEVVVHPECTPEVAGLADRVLSTQGMCRYAREGPARQMIIGTEPGIIHRLKKENPDKKFYPASELAVCPNMKLTTLEKVLWALQEMRFEISLPDDIILKAKVSIQRMLAVKSGT